MITRLIIIILLAIILYFVSGGPAEPDYILDVTKERVTVIDPRTQEVIHYEEMTSCSKLVKSILKNNL